MLSRRRLAAAAAASLSLLYPLGAGGADQCRMLVYQFQPLPYDTAHELNANVAPGQGVFEEGGPQAAIWIESTASANRMPPADRGSWLADVFVTKRTATNGIGNRPGDGHFVSSPRFPYGNRDFVLPIWAFARGRSYPLLVMQDGEDGSFGFHEASSSPEDFFCRPLTRSEIVDALTCPTPIFNSDKGRFDPGGRTSLYPPRADVMAGA